MIVSNLLGNDVVADNTIDKTVFNHLDEAKPIADNDYKLLEYGRLGDLVNRPDNIPFNEIDDKLGRVGIDEDITILDSLGGI